MYIWPFDFNVQHWDLTIPKTRYLIAIYLATSNLQWQNTNKLLSYQLGKKVRKQKVIKEASAQKISIEKPLLSAQETICVVCVFKSSLTKWFFNCIPSLVDLRKGERGGSMKSSCARVRIHK